MNQPTEYPIRRVQDFLTVPPEKVDECLRDFESWLKMARQGEGVAQALEAGGFPPTTFNQELFIWLDDGSPGISIVQFSCGEEVIGRLPVPRPPHQGAPVSDASAPPGQDLSAIVNEVLDRAGPLENKDWLRDELVAALAGTRTPG